MSESSIYSEALELSGPKIVYTFRGLSFRVRKLHTLLGPSVYRSENSIHIQGLELSSPKIVYRSKSSGLQSQK